MIGIFDPGAEVHRNPRNYRRLDDDPPDGGGRSHTSNSDHPAVDVVNLPPSYKESLIKDSTDGDQVAVDFFNDGNIDLQEGDVTRSLVEGMISKSFSCPPLGDSLDPSKLLDNGIEDLQPAAPLSHGSIDMVDEKSHSPRGSREVAMIE
ncbi:hypothetical protein V6N12_031547 [Hibiscus sabdariffa]|uniref:Uncharacterized protein n=1 Tax=Hibiscus sabdariffa TaxID=183260 RepID=A0ABR2CPK4_9ROSI